MINKKIMYTDDCIGNKNNLYLGNIRYDSQNENEININSYSKDLNGNHNIKSNISEIVQNKKNNFDKENEENNNNEAKTNNYQLTNRPNLIKNKILLKEKDYNKNKLIPISYRNTHKNRDNNPFLRKNYSQAELNNKLNINNNSVEIINNGKDELSNFFGKLKIMNFYSSSEIILLIENIITELNLKNDYSFTFKDSCLTITFNDADQALFIFKRMNIEKLKNKYYQNLVIDINFEIKNNNGQNEEIKEIINNENDNTAQNEIKNLRKFKVKKLSLPPKKINNSEFQKMEKFKNLRTYNYSKDNVMRDKLSDKYFDSIYKKYLEYFHKRKEERRKRELNYQNGKEISLQASSPYVENNTKKSFDDFLRKYNGKNIAPANFNGYIDKASVKMDKYKENHLYLVPDFINHWKLREENKKKWIGPTKFQV